MKDTIEGEWHDEALGSEATVVGPNQYVATLRMEGLETRRFVIDVRYNPTLNEAKKLRATVEPKDYLRGETYLGATMTVEIGEDVLFEGEVKKITTNQQDDDFELIVHSPGLKLKGMSTEEKVENEVVFDYMGELVDYYSEVPEEFGNMVDTDRETLQGVEDLPGNIRRVTEETGSGLGTANLGGMPLGGQADGTATYSNINHPAHTLDTIYVKAYTPGTSHITVEVVDSNDVSYSQRVDSADKNRYGEWIAVTPEGLSGSSYDIIIGLNVDTYLMDWRAVHNQKLERTVHTPDIQSFDKEPFYSAHFDDLIDMEKESSTLEDHEGRTYQTTAWNDEESAHQIGRKSVWDEMTDVDLPQTRHGDDMTAGRGMLLDPNYDQHHEFKLRTDSIIPKWQLWCRARIHQVREGESWDWKPIVEINDVTHTWTRNNIGTTLDVDDFRWFRIAEWNIHPDWPNDFVSHLNVVLQAHERTNVTLEIDTLCVTWATYMEDFPDYNFDNTLSKNKGHLDSPESYLEEGYMTYQEQASDENIEEATVYGTFWNTDEARYTYGVSQRVDRTAEFPDTYDGTAIDTQTFYYPGRGHSVKIRLCASGDARDDASPRYGYEPVIFDGLTVDSANNDLDVIYSTSVGDNNLSIMNDMATNRTARFRFDGYEAVIFLQGSIHTDPTLRQEEINSSVTIEDVYQSAEVIGKHNIRSGVIQAKDAPDFVDDHMQIRDDGIEDVQEAVSRAKSFISEHGSIDYEASIRTLPTFAPLGAMMDGSNFNHGQDVEIESINYRGDSATISLGITRNVAREFIRLSSESHGTKQDQTRKGFIIPVGKDEFRE